MGRGTAFRAGRQDRRELRARQPFGQDSSALGRSSGPVMAGDLEQQIGDGAPVPGEVPAQGPDTTPLACIHEE